MTRNGGPEESATQVISTSGGTGNPAGPARPSGGQSEATQAAPATATPAKAAPRLEASQPPPRPVPPRADVRRPDPQRPDPNRAREGNGFRPREVAPTPPTRPETPGGRVRRARLRAVRVDPWSVMKTAFLLSIAFAIVTVVAVTIVWYVLQAAGVYDSISRTVTDVLGSASDTRFNLEDYVGLQRVLGFTALICVVDVVLITAIATLCAFLYNLSASLLGGLEVTLAEDD
ncbi:DUF3566 domain-containing protein [Actinopolymorpha alba]|uniref:DUF3566 domain-containing protein n=1 Tax=Actinopolymorpha alba TaxID=533267 RepID=UPI0003AAA9C4|nr:DUF3566 domain-containing protein [Actinopolymorpha alba]